MELLLGGAFPARQSTYFCRAFDSNGLLGRNFLDREEAFFASSGSFSNGSRCPNDSWRERISNHQRSFVQTGMDFWFAYLCDFGFLIRAHRHWGRDFLKPAVAFDAVGQRKRVCRRRQFFHRGQFIRRLNRSLAKRSFPIRRIIAVRNRCFSGRADRFKVRGLSSASSFLAAGFGWIDFLRLGAVADNHVILNEAQH